MKCLKEERGKERIAHRDMKNKAITNYVIRKSEQKNEYKEMKQKIRNYNYMCNFGNPAVSALKYAPM